MREGLPTAPLEPLLRLVAATNLSIAGRRVHVDDVVPGADVLRRALLAIGAIDGGEQADHAVVADYAFVADGAAVVHRIVAPPHRPVVVVECGAGVSALGAPLRPGVVGTDRADVVLVPAPASAAAPPAVPAVPAVPGPAVPGPAAPGDAAARIHWARRFMPVSRRLAAELRDDGLLAGRAVGLSLVLEPKTAVLALLLAEAGAAVSVFAFAAETDDAVAAELRERGIAVHASATATPAEERAHALAFLTGTNSGTNTGAPRALDVLIDDGAHCGRWPRTARFGCR